jgi:small subunit ribosomal protein S17
MAKQKIVGIVTSAVQDKTIVVTQVTRETHPLYGKKFTKNRKFVAHDEQNEAMKGDRVEIIENRPVSKTKRFVLSKVLEHGHESVAVKKAEVEEEMDAKMAERKAKTEAKKEAEKEAAVKAKKAVEKTPESEEK